MLDSILKNFQNGIFSDIAGSEFKCKIPLSIDVINALLAAAIEDKSAIKKFEVVKIIRGVLKLRIIIGRVSILGKTREVVDRELLVRLRPELNPPDFALHIEVIDGVSRIENEVLETLFDTLFENNTMDFENRTLIINHIEFSDDVVYQNTLSHLVSAKIITQESSVLYDLHVVFPDAT